MKRLLFFGLLISFTSIIFYSCADESTIDIEDEWTLDESGEFHYRDLTKEETIKFPLSSSRSQSCGWADGLGGSMDCTNGTCSTVFIRRPATIAAPNGSSSVCIRCSNGGVGLCRRP